MRISLILLALLTFSCASRDARNDQMSDQDFASTSTPVVDETSSSATGATETVVVDTSSPKAVCQALAQSAVKGDFDGVQKLSLGGGHHKMHKKMGAKAKKPGFQNMRAEYMEKLRDISCNNENIADTHAFVEATSQGEKRLIPFVKTDGGWRFDERTYHSFYHADMMGKKRM